MLLAVNDTNCRMSHSCAIFKDPDIISRDLWYCRILSSFWYHFCGNLSQRAHYRWHSENVNILGCDAVPQCKQFLWFWRFLSPSECWEPTMQRALKTWNTWILMNTTVRLLGVRCHNVSCPCVACTVHATLCYMHWMVLTHPVVNLDQCPFDFNMFSSFKKAPDIS